MKKRCTLSRVLRAFFTVFLSLLDPIVWMHLNPSLSEKEPIKLLTQGIADHDVLEIPSDVIRPELVESHSFKVFGAPIGIARYNFRVAEGEDTPSMLPPVFLSNRQ